MRSTSIVHLIFCIGISREMRINEIFNGQIFPFSCYFSSLKSKTWSQVSIGSSPSSLRETKFDTHTQQQRQSNFTHIYTGHIVKQSLFNFTHFQNTKPGQSIILVTASNAWRRHNLYRCNPVARRVFVFNHYPFSSYYLLLYPTISFTVSFKSKEKDFLPPLILLAFRMRGGGRSWNHAANPIILYFSVYCTKTRTDRQTDTYFTDSMVCFFYSL